MLYTGVTKLKTTRFICGNVANGFSTNCLKPYIRNGVTMRISDILYIFVAMWTCGIIKKYLKNINIYIFTKKLFLKKWPHFHSHISVENHKNPCIPVEAEHIR